MGNKIKEIPSRLILKHDIESNWKRAETFIPKQGEIIIYDIDTDNNYERFKIGDGKTIVNELPFYLEEELLDILNRLNSLEENMLNATWHDGILYFEKGISIP